MRERVDIILRRQYDQRLRRCSGQKSNRPPGIADKLLGNYVAKVLPLDGQRDAALAPNSDHYDAAFCGTWTTNLLR